MPGVDVRHVAALGSSFAAGPGIEPIAHEKARRSARNYPHLLAEQLGATLTDLTVSGATTATVLDTPQRAHRHTFPPQLDGLPSNADLVTITVGGNDLGYVANMVRCAIASRLSASRWTRPFAAAVRGRQVASVSVDDVDRVAESLTRVVDAVRRRTGGARVLLVDYLTVIGPETGYSRTVPFDDSAVHALRWLGEQVGEVFVEAARRSGAELVEVGRLSRTHALGSAEPWVSGLSERSGDRRRAAPFHPNARGMQAIADAIIEHLEDGRGGDGRGGVKSVV